MAAAVATLSMMAAGAATAVSQQAVYRSQVDAVRVDVRVTRGGASVERLSAADFELRDSGVVQTIATASFEQIPLDVQLVLDVSGSVSAEKARSLRDAARALLSGLTAADRAGLLTFSGRVREPQPMTSDLGLVRTRLDELRGGGSTSLHDAVYSALRLREPGVTSRWAVVVFTDGIDNVSWLGHAEVVDAGRTSDAIVHGVIVPPPEGVASSVWVTNRSGHQVAGTTTRQAGPAPAGLSALHELARETGGQVWEAAWGSTLEEAFRAVLEDLRSRYVLTYRPTGVADSGWHALEVKVKRGGKVTARAGYYRTAAAR
jgi:VWFA-related protein